MEQNALGYTVRTCLPALAQADRAVTASVAMIDLDQPGGDQPLVVGRVYSDVHIAV